jgi:hypothetical protein
MTMTLHRLCSLIAVSLASIGPLAAHAHGSPDLPEPTAPFSLNAPPNDYAKAETWLCRPGRQDACSGDLTALFATLPQKAKRQTATRPAKPPVDCFYVYPTVSADPTGNADMNPGDEEQRVAEAQFARFGTLCRTFAPLYRQVTLRGLRSRATAQPMPIDEALPYQDVRDAWQHYLRHDNKGRPVVLIGHSQGARMLTHLLRHEIEGQPVHKQLVSALLLGSNFEVPRGKDVGASLQRTPLCRAAGQTGCVIAFVSFRATENAPDNSRFGLASEPDTQVACTNPAALAGGRAGLHSYFLARVGRMAESMQRAELTTAEAPYIGLKGLAEAECVTRPEATYLAVHHVLAAKALRIDVPGDIYVGHRLLPEWGLHVAEFELTQGSLLSAVKQQIEAFGKRSH